MAKHTPNVAALLAAIGADLILGERPVPTPGSDQVLIRNHFVAVNPIDWKRQAWGLNIPSYPAVLGAGMTPVL